MNKYNMVSHNRRKHQRWLNRYCRYANRVIEEDPLWRGRFYVTQLQSDMEWFEDGSGGIIHALIQMKDRKTGTTFEKWYDGLDMTWEFWIDFNNFIVNKVRVWEENPNPYDNIIDYRKRAK